MITEAEVSGAFFAASKGAIHVLSKVIKDLMEERDAYRSICGRMFIGIASEKTKMESIDAEAQRIIEQRNQSKHSKNGE